MNETWKNILITVISTFLTFLVSYYFYTEQIKIKKLDVHKDFDENYFSNLNFHLMILY